MSTKLEHLVFSRYPGLIQRSWSWRRSTQSWALYKERIPDRNDDTPNIIQINDDARKKQTITAFYLCALSPSYLGEG